LAKSALAEKATTMIDVLKRRSQIENYLTNLKVSRDDDLVSRGVDLNTTAAGECCGRCKKRFHRMPKALTSSTKATGEPEQYQYCCLCPIKKRFRHALIVIPKDIKKPELVNNVTAPPVTESKTYTFNAAIHNTWWWC
jgi:hypothetical protein